MAESFFVERGVNRACEPGPNGFSLADTIPFERDGIGAGHDRTTSAGDRGTHSNCSPGGQRAAGTALKRHVACR